MTSIPLKSWALALAATVVVVTRANGATLQIPAGGNLQAALVNAQPGDTITLMPGATYTGNFTLPDKGGSLFITIQTNSGTATEGTDFDSRDLSRL